MHFWGGSCGSWTQSILRTVSSAAVWRSKSSGGSTHRLLDSNYPSTRYAWSCCTTEQMLSQDPYQLVHCTRIFSIMIIRNVKLIYRARRDGQTERNIFIWMRAGKTSMRATRWGEALSSSRFWANSFPVFLIPFLAEKIDPSLKLKGSRTLL